MAPNVQHSFSFNSLEEAKRYNLPAGKSVVGCKVVKVSSATIIQGVDQKELPSPNMHLNLSGFNAVTSAGPAEGKIWHEFFKILNSSFLACGFIFFLELIFPYKACSNVKIQ